MTIQLDESRESAFWQNVYVAVLQNLRLASTGVADNVSAAAEFADMAVAELRRREAMRRREAAADSEP